MQPCNLHEVHRIDLTLHKALIHFMCVHILWHARMRIDYMESNSSGSVRRAGDLFKWAYYSLITSVLRSVSLVLSIKEGITLALPRLNQKQPPRTDNWSNLDLHVLYNAQYVANFSTGCSVYLKKKNTVQHEAPCLEIYWLNAWYSIWQYMI